MRCINTIKDWGRMCRVAAGRCRIKSSLFEPGERTLIIAPHPDDEVFGCGGIIANAIATGKALRIWILTGGGGSHRGCCDLPEVTIIEQRRILCKKSLALLGCKPEWIVFGDHTDGKLAEAGAALERELEQMIRDFRPDSIFLPAPGEVWPDHLAGYNLSTFIHHNFPGIRIYGYCIWFWYNLSLRHMIAQAWNKSCYFPLSGEYRQKKHLAVMCYRAQAPCGREWIGGLPNLLFACILWKKELFFEL